MTEASYCGRFAPSPTGLLHLGTARTALLAFRRAWAMQGRFILRIEDLDTPRTVPQSKERIVEDLAWLGISWDAEPLMQSRNLPRYAAALEKLRAAGRVYPCSCSRKEIAEIATAPHGEEAVYPGTCRAGLSHPGRPLAWRFHMDDGSGDFVVSRADGVFAYQLACAVDDAESGITEVVRGEDLRSSAARQRAIIEALGFRAPAYLHAPLMLGPDGQRLSKRHASTGIAELRAAGESAGQVIARMAVEHVELS